MLTKISGVVFILFGIVTSPMGLTVAAQQDTAGAILSGIVTGVGILLLVSKY